MKVFDDGVVHLSVDIETWGTRPGCDIRSVGACVFAPYTGRVHDAEELTFYLATDNPPVPWGFDDGLGTKRMYNLHRDRSTVEWWADQDQAAQSAFSDPIQLHVALGTFSRWVSGLRELGELRIWANDPHFDGINLEEAMRACGVEVPWKFYEYRSYRTILEVSGMKKSDRARALIPHHALHDATSQARDVCEAHNRLGLSVGRAS